MSLWEEVGEQQIGRHLGYNTTQQLQQSHSAIQALLAQLQALRSKNGLNSIEQKIRKLEGLLEGKEGIASNQQSAEELWLCQRLLLEQSVSPFLIEMIKKERNFLEDTLRRALQAAFLNEKTQQESQVQNEAVFQTLSELNSLKDQLAQDQTLTRQQLRAIDQQLNYHAQVIDRVKKCMQKAGTHFSRVVNGIHQFQRIASEQFRAHMASISLSQTNHTHISQPPTLSTSATPSLQGISQFPQPILSQPPLDLAYGPPQRATSQLPSYFKTTSSFRPRRHIPSGFNPLKTEGWAGPAGQQQISELGVQSRLNVGGQGRRLKTGGWQGGYR